MHSFFLKDLLPLKGKQSFGGYFTQRPLPAISCASGAGRRAWGLEHSWLQECGREIYEYIFFEVWNGLEVTLNGVRHDIYCRTGR